MENPLSPADEVLAQAAAQAAETDPVLSELDRVLDADPLYHCAHVAEKTLPQGRGITGVT